METFTQPKIVGYRQLNETEAALMNEIKAHGIALQATLTKVVKHISEQNAACQDDAECLRITTADAWRWSNIGKDNLQLGLMALTRAVAQPTTF